MLPPPVGRYYEDVLQPDALDMVAKVFFALRHLGFRDRELSAVLAELRAENHDEAPRASSLLREALSQHGARNARVY